ATGTHAYVHPDDDFLTLDPGAQLQILFGMRPPGDFAPPENLVDLEDGQLLELAGLGIDVIHTPATPRATAASISRRRGSCSRATSCSPARSVAPTFPAATPPPWDGRCGTGSWSCPTTPGCCPVTAPRPTSAASAAPILSASYGNEHARLRHRGR